MKKKTIDYKVRFRHLPDNVIMECNVTAGSMEEAQGKSLKFVNLAFWVFVSVHEVKEKPKPSKKDHKRGT